MFDWIQANSTVLNTLATLGTLLLWLFYAQILYNGYRRQRRPRILINKGIADRDLDAPCLIGNMSQEAIFIQFVLVCLKTNKGSFMVPATDSGEGAVDEEEEGPRTRQGPMRSGEDIKLQSFRELIKKASDEGKIQTRDGVPTASDIYYEQLELFVIYIYGPDDHPVGASRAFDFRHDDDGHMSLHPATIDTNRMTSMRQRRRLKTWLREYL